MKNQRIISQINFDPRKYSRNFKNFKFLDSLDYSSANIKNINRIKESSDKTINIYSPKKPKKLLNNQKGKKNKTIYEENDKLLKQKINQINKFVILNYSRKELQKILQEKLNLSIEPSIDKKESTRNNSIKTIKRISKNNISTDIINTNNTNNTNTNNTFLLIPKIVSFNNPKINNPIPKIKKVEIIDNKNKTVIKRE